MPLPPLHWTAALLLTALAISQAQDPTTTARRTMPRGVSADRIASVFAHDGALLGIARRYRASFEPRSITYRPALGRAAPAAHSFQLQLQHIHRGDTPILNAAKQTPEISHDRQQVIYHWPGIQERYQTTTAGLEQSFVFAERPAGTGDLVVSLDLQTTLPLTGDGKAAWLDTAGNGVTIGAVSGIDAVGRTTPGTLHCGQHKLELRLPGWFVDAASYPLILDPLIGTAVNALPNADCDFPDCAYDAYTDSYCVAWTQYFGGGASDIVGSVWAASDLSFAYAFAVNQAVDADSVRVCNIAGSGVFVMVWVAYEIQGNRIAGIAFDPLQAQATNVWTLYGPAGVHSPIVSGEASVQGDSCIIAWQDLTYGLVGCTLQVNLQLQVGATQPVQLAGGAVAEPCFSKQGGAPGLHLLVWVDRPTGLPGWVRARLFDYQLNPLGPGAWVQTGTQDCGWPAVDGDGFRFLVAWEEQELANPSLTDIRGRLLTVGPQGITSQGAVQDWVRHPGRADFAPDVAMLGDKYGLVYMSAAPQAAPFSDDAWARVLSGNGAPIGGELRLDLVPGNVYRYEHAPRLIGCVDGDPASIFDDGLVVFADQSVTTADSDVGLQQIVPMGPGGSVTDLGGGCGPGGLAVANGACALGNQDFRCELYGAQALSIPFLLLGLPGPLQQCGFCSLLQPLSCQFVANQAGYASAPLPLPGNPALVGLPLRFQFATFQVNYVGCPQTPGLAASNMVEAVVDY